MDNIIRQKKASVARSRVYNELPAEYRSKLCSWVVQNFKRGAGRPRTDWNSSMGRDLKKMGITS